MELTTPQDKTWRKGKIPEPLTRARAHPQWSTLNSHAKPNQAERQEAIDELADVASAEDRTQSVQNGMRRGASHDS
ncbi:hypothetical protein AL060_00710 [Pseudomonas syringae pv. rhaphiolepidis]|nr:hypothetical protein AL060_00710 [Pseudomonas syringae pv. rhaphiolepidis]